MKSSDTNSESIAFFFKQVYEDWQNHDAPRLGAALAFYTVLSLSPLMILAVAVLGLFFDQSTVLQKIIDEIQSFMGPQGANVVGTIIAGAKNPLTKTTSSVVAALVLLIGAAGVFNELRVALSRMWDTKEDRESGLSLSIRRELAAFGMVLASGFLLLVSLLVSTFLTVALTELHTLLSIPRTLTMAIDLVVSIATTTIIFCLIFRYVPDARVHWREAWIGGGVTAVLFSLGKYAIGLYIAVAAVGSTYGSAGSLVAIIVWVYYAAQILLFGAEFTHAYARRIRHLGQKEKLRIVSRSRADRS